MSFGIALEKKKTGKYELKVQTMIVPKKEKIRTSAKKTHTPYINMIIL